MNMRVAVSGIRRVAVMGPLLVAIVWTHPVTADDDTLAAAFLAQCKHMQSCIREKLAARDDADPAMVQMIESRMAGQCEMQVARIEPMEGMPEADRMKACYRAVVALTCAEIEAEPEIPECES